MTGITFDIEANGLLDDTTIDYLSSPYRLKDSFKMHCIVAEEHDTGIIHAFYDGEDYIFDGRPYIAKWEDYDISLVDYEPIEYVRHTLNDFPKFVQEHDFRVVVGHNIINYDLLACKLYFDNMDYSIKYNTWGKKDVSFIDTMILSKTLNPDRYGGHSLDNLSSKTSTRKMEFRKKVPQNRRFEHFSADMLYYCIIDNISNTAVYNMLKEEWGDWKWGKAFKLESRVADIITRQAHRGFKFDVQKAKDNIEWLDKTMAEIRSKIEPMIPKKKATQSYLKDYIPPKNQIKQNGELTAHMIKFGERHNCKFINQGDKWIMKGFGKLHELPIPQFPLVDDMLDATLDDTTHIKEWLVGLGWNPTEYKDKDLMIKLPSKATRTPEELEKAIDDYVDQTLASNFIHQRCERLDTSPINLKNWLKKQVGRGVKRLRVPTNPSFTVGQDKEVCSNLLAMKDKFPYAEDIVHFLTYRHRRNSILGGGAEYDEDFELEKGYLTCVREDGRVPTPADTCGASTARMRHISVANVPRTSSLFGEQMRSLFGADGEIAYQLGYDFDSLEARMEAHYCWKHEKGDEKEYCNSLLLEKPRDVHSRIAKQISNAIKREFSRQPAKNVKYGCTYGAQPPKVAKTIGCDLETGKLIFEAFWDSAFPLKKLKEALNAYWEATGKKYIVGIDGRKVPTRAAHAILNSLFQSAGVICAKQAMVFMEDMLEGEGLLVDFFIDDWKNRSFVQQMIAYHDEAQEEVTKDLVEFFYYSNKKLGYNEDAEDLKEEDKRVKAIVQAEKDRVEEERGIICSDISHSPRGGYYFCYSVAGEIASKAVAKAGEHFKLNVPLTAGYVIGRNWAECH